MRQLLRHYRALVLVAALFAFGAPILSASACIHNQTFESDRAKQVYTADQVVLRVNELQAAAISAEAQGALPTGDTRRIVEFSVAANKVLITAPQGWPAMVRAAWAEAKIDLGVIAHPAIAAAMGAVDVVLAGVLQ